MESFAAAWRAALETPEAYARFVQSAEKRVGSLLEFRLPPPAGSDGGRAAEAVASATPEGSALWRLPFAVKNNIAIEGWKLSCGSKILSGFVSPYTATAVKRLQAAGAVVVGTANLDEFGMGSSTDNSALQRTNNPWDPSRVAGGSSGGSAAAVAAGIVPFALGTDTGGSVRQPASFCGVYGLKPTWGSVSRYGLVAYASSLETIGVLGKTAGITEAAFLAMAGRDPLDQTTVDAPRTDARPIKTLAVQRGLKGLSPEVDDAYRAAIASLPGLGISVVEVDIPSLEYAVPAYYCIACAEASANLARYNGIRYGLRPYHAQSPDELVTLARTEGFGREVKMRVLLGTFVLRSGFQDQYYARAQRIRTAIRRDLDRVFSAADAFLGPTFPVQAFPHGDESMDAFAQKQADLFTVTANLAGIPALSFPAALTKGLPIGLQVQGPAFSERRLLDFAKRWATEVWAAPDCPGSKQDWSVK